MSEMTESEDPFRARFNAATHQINKTNYLNGLALRVLANQRARIITQWRVAHPEATWEATAKHFGVTSARLRGLRRKGTLHER